MGERKLGELELLVLLAALQLPEGEAHAVSITKRIGEGMGRTVVRATVYVALQRLEEKGLVTTWLGEPLPERGGRPRRLVKVQPEGIRRVRETRAGLERMWAGLDEVLDRG